MTPKYQPPDIGQMPENNVGPAPGWPWQWLREKVSAIGFRAMADGCAALRRPAWEQMRSQAAQRWRDIRQLWASFALTRWLVLLGAAGRGRAQRLQQTLLQALQAALVVGLLAQPLVAYADTPTPKGSEFQVNIYTTDWQEFPSVAMDADGDFVVAWESPQDGSGFGVYARRYNANGTPAGSEFRINTCTTNNQWRPSVAMDADGDFVVAWESKGQDGHSYGVYAQRYNSSGVAQGSEFRVNTYTAIGQWFPSVAMDADGDFVVAWQSSFQDGSNEGVYAQRYNANGTPAGSEFRVNTYTTNHQHHPRVAMDADGDFVVAWESRYQDGSQSGVYAQRYNSSGVAQGSEFLVNTYTTDWQSSPSVALDADGDFVVAWESYQDGSGFAVYARRYQADGAPDGSEFQVNTYTTGNQWYPSVALDADGDFVVAWQSEYQDGSQGGVCARRYQADGTPDGSEFQVNIYTIRIQGHPSVALDADGDFVVAWQSSFQDGSGYGVYARLYAPTATAGGPNYLPIILKNHQP